MPGLRDAERHNPSIDERLVDIGLCGQEHLPSGRLRVLLARHRGGCQFVPPEQAELWTAEDERQPGHTRASPPPVSR